MQLKKDIKVLTEWPCQTFLNDKKTAYMNITIKVNAFHLSYTKV